MNLHEYQSKRLFADYGIPVPRGIPAESADAAVAAANELGGELWVVNPGKHSLENYTDDGNLRSFLENISPEIDGFSGCCNPTHISLRSDGSFVTSEKGIERVKIHLPSGDYHCLVAGSSSFTEGTTDMDLAVDSDDRVIIMDPKRGLVRIFEEKKLND